jgi:hypothetical protein
VHLPDGHDVNSLWVQQGREAILALVEADSAATNASPVVGEDSYTGSNEDEAASREAVWTQEGASPILPEEGETDGGPNDYAGAELDWDGVSHDAPPPF